MLLASNAAIFIGHSRQAIALSSMGLPVKSHLNLIAVAGMGTIGS